MERVMIAESVSQYAMKFLQDNVAEQHYQNIVQRDAILLFCRVQAEFDGVVTLLGNANKLQPNTAQLQIRSMFEAWLGISLVASDDGETWARYLEVTSKGRVIKRARDLHEASAIDDDQLKTIVDNANKAIEVLGAKFDFPKMPLFDTQTNQDAELEKFGVEMREIINQCNSSRKTQLINQLSNILSSKQKKQRDFVKKPLGVLEMCQVVDNYYPPKDGGVSNVQWYERIYSHLSDYAHGDLSNASGVVTINEQMITTNIAGDADYGSKLLSSATIIELGSLEYLAKILGVEIGEVLADFSSRLGIS